MLVNSLEGVRTDVPSAPTSNSANVTWLNCGFLDTSLKKGRIRLQAALQDCNRGCILRDKLLSRCVANYGRTTKAGSRQRNINKGRRTAE